MSGTREIIDFAVNDQGKEMRDALYAEIHDRIMSHIETKKQEIAQNFFAQEAKEHDDEAEDKALVKKMVKGKCLNKEGVEEDDELEFDEEDEDEDEELDENLSHYSMEEIEEFMQTEEYAQLDELSKDTLKSYVQKGQMDYLTAKKDRRANVDKAYRKVRDMVNPHRVPKHDAETEKQFKDMKKHFRDNPIKENYGDMPHTAHKYS